MKQEYQDFIEKLFDVISPINKGLLDNCEIYNEDSYLSLVWRGSYDTYILIK